MKKDPRRQKLLYHNKKSSYFIRKRVYIILIGGICFSQGSISCVVFERELALLVENSCHFRGPQHRILLLEGP